MPANDAGVWWQRLMRGLRRLHARADWADFVSKDWPERIMLTDVTDDFHAKQGRSTGRVVLESGGKQLSFYLKRHFELPRWCGLLAALWPGGDWSPAMRECRNLRWAFGQGLPVPKVVAAGEFVGPWGKLQSFLAIEELEGMLALHQAIPLAARTLDPVTFRTWKAGLIREIARLARFLHDRNRFHKDLYLCHFFICRADITRIPMWTNRVFMIDFHRLTHHPMTGALWISKDLGQLLYSSEIEGIDARDRLRFWRAYMGDARRGWRGRWLRQIVVLRGRRYSTHNAKWEAKRNSGNHEIHEQHEKKRTVRQKL
jgi:heptose I phosphotransferase